LRFSSARRGEGARERRVRSARRGYPWLLGRGVRLLGHGGWRPAARRRLRRARRAARAALLTSVAAPQPREIRMPLHPVIVFLGGLVVIVVGAEVMLRGSTRIAAMLGIRPRSEEHTSELQSRE